jgi:VCBS repeat-containing protein
MAQNIAPTVDLNGPATGTGTSIGFTENDQPTRIAPSASVSDPDSPNFGGGTLTVRITAGAAFEDQLRVVEGAFVISEQDILYRTGTEPDTYVRIGTISGGTDGSTPLVIFLTDDATPGLVQELVRSIAFVDYSDAPTQGQRTVEFILTDGDGGTSAPATATVAVTATDDPATAVPDHVFAVENAVTTGSVFDDNGNGADSDPDGTIRVSAVNGTANVGKTIQLASGALVTVNSDGTYSYDPNHAFDYLVAGTGGANTQAEDSFTYSVAGGNETTVTVTLSGAYSRGSAILGTGDDDDIGGTNDNDLFDLTQGGVDTVSGKDGDDYMYLGGAFVPGDSLDGGPGFDVVALLGTYDLTLGAASLVGVERLALFSGPSLGGQDHVTYRITTNDGNVAAGETLHVLATGLLADETLTFNGLAEKDGRFEIYGGAGNDVLVGGQQKDILVGNDGNDSLYGMAGSDWLAGGGGADQLRGGFGVDIFAFRAVSDSTPRTFDTIADFEHTQDRIDVHEIDSNSDAAGDQAFTFIGAQAFSHTAGELRAYQLEGSSWAVEGDVNGDGVADFYVQVNLAGPATLTASDFML